MRIVGEDHNTFLIIWQDPTTGEQRVPQWIEKSIVPPSLSSRWDDYKNALSIHANECNQAASEAVSHGTDFYTVISIDNTMLVLLEPTTAIGPALTQAIERKYPGAVGWHLPEHPPSTKPLVSGAPQNELDLQEADSEIGMQYVDPQMPTYDTPCTDPPFAAYVQDHADAFICCDLHHGTDFLYSCSKCREAAVDLLTAPQQDSLDNGAFFTLCDDCGAAHSASESMNMPCECLQRNTKCSRCIWATLDGMAAAKEYFLKRSERSRCYVCSAMLRGEEKVSKCAYCTGIQARP